MSIPRLDLGHGIGLRTQHFADLLAAPPPVDWVEALSENFMSAGGRPLAVLEQVRREVPVVLHGVALSLGSVEPLSERYLAELERLVRRIEPAAVSDHLCWGTHRGSYLHDLLPLPYTEEALDHVSARVRQVQDRLGRQLLLENPAAYVQYRGSTLREWEFLAELCARADCGVLLDVNNVHVSSRNLGYDAEAYLEALPPERVGYVHLAGHTDQGEWILDSHAAPVPPGVWALYRRAVQRYGRVPSLVEWDEAVPPLEVLAAQSRRAAEIEAEELAAEVGAPRVSAGEGRGPSSLGAAHSGLPPSRSMDAGAARRDPAQRSEVAEAPSGRRTRPQGGAPGAGAQPPEDVRLAS